ncbi:MAG: hypothetical protein ABJA57_13200 [Ginsengibacter sp.]
MIILQIEHAVPSYEGWKIAFENDPVDRKGSGVLCYTTYRKTEDPNYIIIDLEFEYLEDAEALLMKLQKLWQQVEGRIMTQPKTRLLEKIETVIY